MKDYTDYIDNALKDLYSDPSLEEDLDRFKAERKMAMRDRETTLRKRGLSDSKILNDLIISENKDIRADFINHRRETLEKRIENRLFYLKILLSISYFIFVGIAFLLDTFYNKDFDYSWIIIVASIVLYTDVLLMMPKKWHYKGKRKLPFSVATTIAILFTAFFFWLIMEIIHQMPNSAVVITATMFLITFFDSFIPVLTHEKHGIWHTIMAPPGIGLWAYITLGLLHVIHWATGWMLIVAGIAVSLIIFVIYYSRSHKLLIKSEQLRLENLANKEVQHEE